MEHQQHQEKSAATDSPLHAASEAQEDSSAASTRLQQSPDAPLETESQEDEENPAKSARRDTSAAPHPAETEYDRQVREVADRFVAFVALDKAVQENSPAVVEFRQEMVELLKKEPAALRLLQWENPTVAAATAGEVAPQDSSAPRKPYRRPRRALATISATPVKKECRCWCRRRRHQ